jgi:ABC-type sugar transport system substrate-binding protein
MDCCCNSIRRSWINGRCICDGIEFTKESIPFIKEGKIDMLSNYSIENTGYTAMETATKYLNGEQVPEFVEIKHKIVTKDNVDEITPEL